MRKHILWVIPFLLIGCGGPVTESATRSDAVAGGNGQSQWVLTPLTFGPGEFLAQMDTCLPGETLQYVGTIYINDHYVYQGGTGLINDNWDIWYDPAWFVSLTTGQKWLMGPGFNNHGRWVLDGNGNKVAGVNHEYYRLMNDTTGQVIWIVYRWQVTVNAAGEYKRDYMYVSCPITGP